MIAKTFILAAIVCAVFLRSAAAQGTNLALGQPATQSSTYTGSGIAYASRAVDGNTNTNWAGGSCTHTNLFPKDFEPWWRVDLGSPKTLGTVKLWNRGDCCPWGLQGVNIYLGNDASAFGNNPACATNVVVPVTPAGFEVPCVGTGRYVYVAHAAKTEVLTICEFEAYGPTSTHDPAVSAFCDDIATKCTSLDAECTTIRNSGQTAIADDCDASVAACNDIESDCRDKAASCPLV